MCPLAAPTSSLSPPRALALTRLGAGTGGGLWGREVIALLLLLSELLLGAERSSHSRHHPLDLGRVDGRRARKRRR